MNNSPQNTPGNIIFSNIEKDPYLLELYDNILYNYSIKLFDTRIKEWKPVNIDDALRFADLLSKSTHPKKADSHKILAQEIVALLKYIYADKPNSTEHHKISHCLGSILSNTGNYLGRLEQAPSYQSKNLLDSVYSEFAEDYMSIPAVPSSKFLPSQKTIYDKLSGAFLSYSGPTSMGKSFIMRMFIKKQLMDNAKLNFALIVPTKALINEINSKITEDLGNLISEKNYKIVSSPGSLFLKSNHNFIFILTPERLLYLLIGYPNLTIDYLFIDEAQKISSSDTRSAFYYKAVEVLLRQLDKPHTIFASPNIPNPEVYLKLVSPSATDINAVASTFSPVSQIKYFIDHPSRKIKIFNKLTEEFNIITDINPDSSIIHVLHKLGYGRKNIVYCHSKASVIDLARKYITDLKLPDIVGDKELDRLASDIETEIHDDCYLAQFIRKGVAYHVGYLPTAIRMRIEKAFKDNKNLSLVFCTSTLVEGVNLPADNLFITSYYSGIGEMNSVDFANLSGRVGRIEFNLYGNVFLTRVTSDTRNMVEKFEKMFTDKVPEQQLSIVSEISSTQKQKIIDCLVQGNMELIRHPKNQSNESFELMRKFAIILVRNIVKGEDSIVKLEFAEYLTNGVEEQIRCAFAKHNTILDDDINMSVDQTESLTDAIESGLTYPQLDENGYVPYDELMDFLLRLCKVFKWDIYEKATLGKLCTHANEHGNCEDAYNCYLNNDACRSAYKCENCKKHEPHKQLRMYAVVLGKWLQGHGLKWIIKETITFKKNNPTRAIMLPDHSRADYNGSLLHKNLIIAETLDIIENVILFKMANYFLKFSTEYKKIHGVDSLKHDWYEYVEYGTTNELSIFFQRNGFERDVANFIKDKSYFVKNKNGDYRIKKSILLCDNESILLRLRDNLINSPELFVE